MALGIGGIAEEGPIAAAGGPIGLAIWGVATVLQILGGLFGIFGGGGGVTVADVQKLRDDTNRAIDTSYRFSWKVAFSIGAIMNSLGWLWNKVIKQLITRLATLAKTVSDTITKVIVPALQTLQKIRDLLNKLYDKFVRPLLSYIQLVRKYLQILKALHIPFADKLDGILARIQGKIIAPYLWVLRTVNGYGRWINLIITAQGTIQRAVFLNSHYRYQSTWVGMFWNSQTSKQVAGKPATIDGVPVARDSATVTQDVADFASFDGGNLAGVAEKSASIFREALSL